MKKTKLFTRVISFFLIAIIVIGLIVPCVSAAEVDDDAINQAIDMIGSTLVQMTDGSEASSEDYDLDSIDSDNDIYPPEFGLPYGFEYVLKDGLWVIEKLSDNTEPAVTIDSMPIDYDANRVTVFVGNLETYEVKHYDLYRDLSYISSMDLDEGYYVVFANGYAWADSNGDAYAINGGDYQYIYIGDDYDPDRYGVAFETTDKIFGISMGLAPDGMKVVDHNVNLIIDDADQIYPEDAKLKVLNDEHESDNTEPTITTGPVEDVDDDTEKDKNDGESIITVLFSIIKRCPILIGGIVVCGALLWINDAKKKKADQERMEADKYDEGNID